ncbi:hypothetical protein HB662_01380 [Roseomonas frigidaquae]|uniref:Transposase n=1 Tax=Falsiroseomonas frigidaquae TaxID=487318 RepID=A0ABX1ES09_9PROT|nr:hypothetical protein [Falsiroseomonas frigidaquae]NKE43411.1 hypothetical protein [Falsiroseomonas frigidaquae]
MSALAICGAMRRFIVIWRDERGQEVARDTFNQHGAAVVRAFCLDQMRQYPTRTYRISEEAAPVSARCAA